MSVSSLLVSTSLLLSFKRMKALSVIPAVVECSFCPATWECLTPRHQGGQTTKLILTWKSIQLSTVRCHLLPCSCGILQERPDAILPTMGGQTGLNLAKNLAESGMLDKYGVELIGAKLPSIDRAEDRELFKQAMKRIGLKTPPRYGLMGAAAMCCGLKHDRS